MFADTTERTRRRIDAESAESPQAQEFSANFAIVSITRAFLSWQTGVQVADRTAEQLADRTSAAEAVAHLFEQHGDAVEAVARGLTRDAHLAADVCQVVFSKALTRLSDIPAGAARAWLLRVAKNEAIDVLRKRGRERKHIQAFAVPGPTGQGTTDEQSGERRLLFDERIAAIREVIDDLPDFDREIVRRRFELGETFAVIADAMDKPLGTVLSRAHRLMKTLQTRLKALQESETSLSDDSVFD